MSEHNQRQSYYDRERGQYRYANEPQHDPHRRGARDWDIDDDFRPAQHRAQSPRDRDAAWTPSGHSSPEHARLDWQQAQRDWSTRGDTAARGLSRMPGRDETQSARWQEPRAQRPSSTSAAFRGPKNFGRSDARLLELVSDKLAEQAQLDPSEIEVGVQSGVVTLRGTVQARHEKFWAEEVACSVGGVCDVRNELRIRRPE